MKLNDEQKKEYARMREYTGAANAFRAALSVSESRQSRLEEMKKRVAELLERGRPVFWREGPICFSAKIKRDEYPDLSHLGEYSDKKGPGAIDRFRGNEEKWRRYREFRYFIPANTEEEHRCGLRAMGFTRGESGRLAKEYVLRDFKRMETHDSEWEILGIIVTASVNGINLANSSLWGIESDSDKEYFASILCDLADEAKSEAMKKLSELQAVAL